MKKETTMSILEFPIPDSEKLECHLLNSLLAENDKVPACYRLLREDFFSTDNTKDAWKAISQAYQNGEQIDFTTIHAMVKDQDWFINEVMTAEYTFGGGVMQLAERLVEAYTRRIAYHTSVDILQSLHDHKSVNGIYSLFTGFADKVEQNVQNNGACTALAAAQRLEEDLKNGKDTRVATPFTFLNHLLYGGFAGGSLVVLAARPSVGKTTLALQMAQAAAFNGNKTHFFSLEMSEKDLVRRMVIGTGEISAVEIYSGNIDWKRYAKAVSMAMNENLWINSHARTLAELKTNITIESKRKNCDIAFIDYLGLVSHDDRRKTYSQVLGDITQELKSIASQCNIPIVLLCQLNRESAKEYRSPELYDLRDSGSIEQDGDVIMMLERPRDEDNNVIDGRIDLWLKKNRLGKTSTTTPIKLVGNETYFGFKEDYDLYADKKEYIVESDPDEDDDKDDMPF